MAVLTLFLCGDVMTGRGIDQILPHPGEPRLYESYVKDARDYVALAETRSGPIARPVMPGDIWGDALEELDRQRPDLRLINLETSITRAGTFWPDKGIHYRMHPDNIGCLRVAGVDCCALANNHVLDWGREGLRETLSALAAAGIAGTGAGLDAEAATAPAIFELPGKGRVRVYAFGTESSGIPPAWAAGPDRPGVQLLPDLGAATITRIGARIRADHRAGDTVIASIHWGGNWGYRIPGAHQTFARRLIDQAGVDVIHGHSSHHPLAIEVYRDRPILYGCGDFLNDYEGIGGGHELFRGELVLMYFLRIDAASGALRALRMRPLRIQRLRLARAEPPDAGWLGELLNREGVAFGTRVEAGLDGYLKLRWH